MLKDLILKANDTKTEKVAVPEWGVDVYVKGMTGAEQDDLNACMFSIDDKGRTKMNRENTTAKLLVKTLCDENGTPIFSELDVVALGKKNGAVLRRLFDVAQKLSGMSVDEAEKN